MASRLESCTLDIGGIALCLAPPTPRTRHRAATSGLAKKVLWPSFCFQSCLGAPGQGVSEYPSLWSTALMWPETGRRGSEIFSWSPGLAAVASVRAHTGNISLRAQVKDEVTTALSLGHPDDSARAEF